MSGSKVTVEFGRLDKNRVLSNPNVHKIQDASAESDSDLRDLLLQALQDPQLIPAFNAAVVRDTERGCYTGKGYVSDEVKQERLLRWVIDGT